MVQQHFPGSCQPCVGLALVCPELSAATVLGHAMERTLWRLQAGAALA
jgi:hypothetical protein